MSKRKKLILSFGFAVLLLTVGLAIYLIPKNQKGSAETNPHIPIYSHIKTFLYAWTVQPSDFSWLNSHIDWMRMDPNLISSYRSSGGTAPIWVYMLYHSVIGEDYNWLRNWANANGKNWENLFVHFSQNTVHRPINEGSAVDTSKEQRLNKVFVFDGATYLDKTQNGCDPASSSFSIGNNANSVLYTGYNEPFKEANFTLQTPANGWQGVWEYWNGSSWATLNPTDGTANMTKNGRIEKNPPPMSTWKRNTVNNVELWWWRLRTTALGAVQPVVAAGGLTGRNYITFTSSYYSVPGWDQANDLDGDGYAELNNNPNASALFRYESRASYYELNRYYLNIGSVDTRDGVAQMALDKVSKDLGGGYHYDSIFLDNGHPTIVFDNKQSGGTTIEDISNEAWKNNNVATLQAIKGTVGSNIIVFLNTSSRTDSVTETFIDAVDGFHGENYINVVGIYPKSRIDAIVSRNAEGKWCQVHANGVAVNSDWERSKMTSLALFYLTKGDNTFYEWGFDGEPGSFKDNFYNAIEYNVGQPKSSYYILHQEDDPSCSHDQYGIAYIYAREFDKVLSVALPLPHYDSTFTPSYTTNLPTYDIGGGQTSDRYQKLNSDGTIDPNIITSITLRNAEGAILVKTDVQGAVNITKQVDKIQAASGETLTYTINYGNYTAASVTNAKIEDPIPTGTTFVSAGNGGTSDGTKVIWNLGTLAAGASGTVTLQVKIQ